MDENRGKRNDTFSSSRQSSSELSPEKIWAKFELTRKYKFLAKGWKRSIAFFELGQDSSSLVIMGFVSVNKSDENLNGDYHVSESSGVATGSPTAKDEIKELSRIFNIFAQITERQDVEISVNVTIRKDK
ncbi:hypothetical protein Fot_08379 [Forsythia ovata]|uniref:Uncharacterized protein n=1 Tax=Forsythia ovata TaxID=205694 RepID=A0ABD1WYH1_9LAMI